MDPLAQLTTDPFGIGVKVVIEYSNKEGVPVSNNWRQEEFNIDKAAYDAIPKANEGVGPEAAGLLPILANIPGTFPHDIGPLGAFFPVLDPFLLIPPWLAPHLGMQQGNGGVQFPAGNGGGAEPLILDLNGDGARSTRLGYGAGQLSHTYFDMDNDGFAERTAWVSSGDGLLVMDKNGNGKIDNQNELFGNNATYADGFANLKQYDSNNDNKMTSADAQWNNLRVWVDADGDAVTDAGELKTLAQLNITQINLNATALTNTFDNENEVGATGTFVMNGQTRQVNDVWFRVDQTSSHYMGAIR